MESTGRARIKPVAIRLNVITHPKTSMAKFASPFIEIL
jgi:hypothetical protein